MDSNRMKKAAEWFYSTVFRDEAIRPRPGTAAEKLPSLLRTARSLETGVAGTWQSREALFLKQAKLLANYEDDYAFDRDIIRYYPTYQSLTDQELRGYFSWRTKLRKGDIRKTSLSFAFLYIYELINQVGVEDPLDGFYKLKAFRDSYSQLDEKIVPYLDAWLTDYVVYYALDANLLANSPQVLFDRSIAILDMVQHQEPAKVIYAVKTLAPKWLQRSKFYNGHTGNFDEIIVNVLRKVSEHYEKHAIKPMVEQIFGAPEQFQVRLFNTAVFCNPLKKRNCEYVLDERCIYRCNGGLWTVTKQVRLPSSKSKLEDLLKTVDAIMREEYNDPHPIKCEIQTKWLLKLIRLEVQAFLAKKKAAEAKKISIDYSQLAKIRREAAITQDKLTVEEEPDIPEIPQPQPSPLPEPIAEAEPSHPVGSDLFTEPEYRLLQCMLYGGSIGWVQSEGYMISVLTDSINEKLYDIFLDSVMDDTPELVEDYIDDLKEMIKP